jgi:hypothetical protein
MLKTWLKWGRVSSVAATAALAIALIGAYANHFQNGFHFDDAHTIETNAAIRGLQNIPFFFRDATTFSALPSNQSYRPLATHRSREGPGRARSIDFASSPRRPFAAKMRL